MNIVLQKSKLLLLVLSGALGLLPSCATSPKTAHGPKFYEENSANLVIRYDSDQAVFRLKPDGHEGPFYRVFNRQQLCEEDAMRAGQRNLAVVLMGNQWTPELDRQVKQGWLDTLARLNYRRIVILRSGDWEQVNGLQVEEDRQMAQSPIQSHEFGLVSAAPSQVTVR